MSPTALAASSSNSCSSSPSPVMSKTGAGLRLLQTCRKMGGELVKLYASNLHGHGQERGKVPAPAGPWKRPADPSARSSLLWQGISQQLSPHAALEGRWPYVSPSEASHTSNLCHLHRYIHCRCSERSLVIAAPVRALQNLASACTNCCIFNIVQGLLKRSAARHLTVALHIVHRCAA